MMKYLSILLLLGVIAYAQNCPVSKERIQKLLDAINNDPYLLENFLQVYESIEYGMNKIEIDLQETPEHSRKRSAKAMPLLDKQMESMLASKIPRDNMRYPTAYYMLQLFNDRNVKTIVETGTSRDGDKNCHGDGCSTLIYGYYARIAGGKMFSIDISAQNCYKAREACTYFGDTVEIIQSDSIKFLREYKGNLIDFLYLDSYDFDGNNPDPSQKHHELEIEAAYDKLHKRSIVMVDDCSLKCEGKCKLVRKYLLHRGWKLIMNKYQQIFVYEE